VERFSVEMTTTGSEQRALIHVDDCCRMILRALECPSGLGPITVASSRQVRLAEVAELLCEIAEEETGKRLQPEAAPDQTSGHDVIFDVGKMERHLGVERVQLEEGLREEFRSFAAERQ
jgi:nucleoside-diphosphate-sugar epimerase